MNDVFKNLIAKKFTPTSHNTKSIDIGKCYTIPNCNSFNTIDDIEKCTEVLEEYIDTQIIPNVAEIGTIYQIKHIAREEGYLKVALRLQVYLKDSIDATIRNIGTYNRTTGFSQDMESDYTW